MFLAAYLDLNFILQIISCCNIVSPYHKLFTYYTNGFSASA